MNDKDIKKYTNDVHDVLLLFAKETQNNLSLERSWKPLVKKILKLQDKFHGTNIDFSKFIPLEDVRFKGLFDRAQDVKIFRRIATKPKTGDAETIVEQGNQQRAKKVAPKVSDKKPKQVGGFDVTEDRNMFFYKKQ